MAAHAMRFPPAPRRRRRWPLRMLGLLATAALLGSGAAIVYMVMPDHGTVATTPPAVKVKVAPKAKGGLTKAQKRARHDAVAVLSEQGYEPARLADWRPRSALKVLLGRDEQGAMRAFFFADGKFIGHDDPATSNDIRVVKAGKETVTLSYGVSTGGREKITFRLLDGAVDPTAAVPPSTVR